MQIVPPKTVMLASSNSELLHQLNANLCEMRWHVREALGGADVLTQLEDSPSEALLLDHWLPDLEIVEFVGHVKSLYPHMELLHFDGDPIAGCKKSAHRNELLHALRKTVAGSDAGNNNHHNASIDIPAALVTDQSSSEAERDINTPFGIKDARTNQPDSKRKDPLSTAQITIAFNEMIGQSAQMVELKRMILLVAPHTATVLIEGETGTGKELVARALHRLSPRSDKPFVALNCAAIPEALIEAELFGHTRGAFTGALQSRIGRIEAAQGGTLFLDEIGEMPLPLQAKLLRFLENGEIQRVGNNEITRVEVRVVAATHQQLQDKTKVACFRLDLYHRLAVFPIQVPPLRDRSEDIPGLCEHFLRLMSKAEAPKTLSPDTLEKLLSHDWSGNVRELAHVLQRASIFAGDSPEIYPEDIRFGR